VVTFRIADHAAHGSAKQHHTDRCSFKSFRQSYAQTISVHEISPENMLR
jgi:hypothetical protein